MGGIIARQSLIETSLVLVSCCVSPNPGTGLPDPSREGTGACLSDDSAHDLTPL